MKTVFVTMAALSALSISAPAAAQRWGTHTDQSSELRTQIEAGVASGAITQRETVPLQAGLRQLISLERQFGADGISGREHGTLQQLGATLRQQIDSAQRDSRFARHDSRYEQRDSRYQQRDSHGRYNGERRSDWEAAYDREHRADWESRYLRDRGAAWESRFAAQRSGGFDRYGSNGPMDMNQRFGAGFDRPNRGDRFAGDVRVGQRTSFRMVSVPDQYRDQFRDDDRVYYRYDDKRIYQIDRRTDTVLGLLDILN